MKLSWPWPACSTPKSLSFRAPTNDTVKSPQFEEYIATDSPEEDAVEAVIRGLRKSTERLFYEPEETSLVVVEKEEEEEKKKKSAAAAADAAAVMTVEVESEDPCLDFKKSMVEMVEAYGLKEWDSLEELLSWYLKVNTKKNHGYVVRAFLDLLTFLDFTTSSCSSSSSSCNTSSNSYHHHHHHHHHHHQCCCSSCSSTTTTSGGGVDSSYVTTTSTNTCCSSTSSTSPCLSCSLQAEDDDDEEEEEEIRIKSVLVEVDDD